MPQSKALLKRDIEPLPKQISIESELFSKMVSKPEAREAMQLILTKRS